ncbi:hypothetical protein ABTN31_18685, partial [Acinetobacter baumannii]
MIDAALLASLRAQTPGLERGLHLNHAGASLLPQSALQAIHAHLQLEAELGPMEAALAVSERMQTLRANAARLINANNDEIAFMTSGS